MLAASQAAFAGGPGADEVGIDGVDPYSRQGGTAVAVPGSEVSVRLYGNVPDTRVFFAVSAQTAVGDTCFDEMAPKCVDLVRPLVLLGGVMMDGDGDGTKVIDVPSSAAPGTYYIQAIQRDGSGGWRISRVDAIEVLASDGDAESDGVTNWDEIVTYGTDPYGTDTDGDGLTDGDEVHLYGCDPIYPDTDDDGLPDADEVLTYGTDCADEHSDGDLLTDDEEIYDVGTDPLLADTDGNGINDHAEDGDADGLTNGEELRVYGTDPKLPDTDFGGIWDGDEVLASTDPLDGWDDGPDWLLLFVTADPVAATFGSLGQGDALCSIEARAAGWTGSFRVLVSTSTVNVIDRLSEGIYARSDGKRVSLTKDGLTGNMLDSFFLDATGAQPEGSSNVWSGSSDSGVVIVDWTCGDWTSTSGVGGMGVASFSNGWMSNGGQNCSGSHRLACAQIVDADGDNLSDDEEIAYGTDPNNPDSDADSVTDGDEVWIDGTDPNDGSDFIAH